MAIAFEMTAAVRFDLVVFCNGKWQP
ncbi:hypothetical protein E3A20_13860, partial [Planctomyces bekefii]